MFKFILLQILLFATFKVQSLEIIETSESVQFEQGTSDFLFCQADDSVDFCSWTKDGVKCLASQGQEVPCDELSNARVNLEDGKCGLHLEGLTRAEVGTYACTLILGQDNVQGMYRNIYTWTIYSREVVCFFGKMLRVFVYFFRDKPCVN